MSIADLLKHLNDDDHIMNLYHVDGGPGMNDILWSMYKLMRELVKENGGSVEFEDDTFHLVKNSASSRIIPLFETLTGIHPIMTEQESLEAMMTYDIVLKKHLTKTRNPAGRIIFELKVV